MRSEDSPKVRFQTRVLVTILVASGLAACSSGGSAQVGPASNPAMADSGPSADYPILVGAPYEVAGTIYTPADVMNYDEVGYITQDVGGMGYTGAHHTLPVPSYVEVTSLESGRTVLVRLEERGPMASNHIVALSPDAMAQLGASGETPVRVRRVNPPEEQRAKLRAGEAAPLRMDTPASLLTVLRRRLPESGTASLAAANQPPRPIESVDIAASAAMPVVADPAANDTAPAPREPAPVAVVDLPALAPLDSVPNVETQSEAVELAAVEPAPPEVIATQPVDGGFVVQAAAFSNPDNARRAANALGGNITRSGQFYRVRTGPFATRGEAEASLANVRRAGYSDARILTSG